MAAITSDLPSMVSPPFKLIFFWLPMCQFVFQDLTTKEVLKGFKNPIAAPRNKEIGLLATSRMDRMTIGCRVLMQHPHEGGNQVAVALVAARNVDVSIPPFKSLTGLVPFLLLLMALFYYVSSALR